MKRFDPMPPSYLATRTPKRIAVFRALQLGDLLCAVPALRALRRSAPHAHIALVGLPTMKDFIDRFAHLVDELIPFPGAPGFPEQDANPELFPQFLSQMRMRKLDLAVQLHGSGALSNPLVASFGAKVTAGFHRSRGAILPGRVVDGPFFLTWEEHDSEVRRGLSLMALLGADRDVVDDVALELPIRPEEREAWRALRVAHGLRDEPIVCVHAGARWPSRRWPIDRFAAVALALASGGARIVLTGSDDERPFVGRLAAALAARQDARRLPAIDLSGQTSLGALAALLQETDLLVCNDTGISHVAAAVGTRSVVVASGSDVARWAPLDGVRHRVLAHDVPCRPCMYRECPIGHPCALGVSVGSVLDAAHAQFPSLSRINIHAA